MFSTWRRPFPYLLHRWDVHCDGGWCAGFWTLRKACEWMEACE
jgi:hypothetical protein